MSTECDRTLSTSSNRVGAHAMNAEAGAHPAHDVDDSRHMQTEVRGERRVRSLTPSREHGLDKRASARHRLS